MSRRVGRLASVSFVVASSILPTSANSATERPGFPRTIVIPEAVVGYHSGVTIVDLAGNGERRLVICVQGLGTGAPWVYPSRTIVMRGSGTIESSFVYESYPIPIPAFLDVDDDGAWELAMAEGDAFRVRRPDGTVLWEKTRIAGDPLYDKFYPRFVSVAELDGDGKSWLVVLTEFNNRTEVFVFDRNGALRFGWPISLPRLEPFPRSPPIFYAPPAVVDLQGDPHVELLAVDNWGWFHCWQRDGSTCSGFPIRPAPGENEPTIWTAPLSNFDSGGSLRCAASDSSRDLLHLFGADYSEPPPFPLPMNEPFPSGVSIAEIGSRPFIASHDWGIQHLVDAETGAEYPGWPVSIPYWGQSQPVVGDLGGPSTVGYAFSGRWLPPQGGTDSKQHLVALDSTGSMIPGFPITVHEDWAPIGHALGTLDGVETTLCSIPGSDDDNVTTLHCLDLGVPWDRGKVQFGMYAFDLQRTSRWRRLWQIDRAQTSLSIPLAEIPSEGAPPLDVTVCPKQADGSILGPDQEIRFARRPVLGNFSGAVRYDATTGCSSRTFVPPSQPNSAEVEFRVFVNEELHSQKPVLRLRGRPVLSRAEPATLALATRRATLRLTGLELAQVASLELPPELLDLGWQVISNTEISFTAGVAPGATSGPIGIVAVAGDGRRSAPLRIVLLDPAGPLLLATKIPNATRLEWFAAPGGLATWRLERSLSADFRTATTVYRGPLMVKDDTPPNAPVVFWRVRKE